MVNRITGKVLRQIRKKTQIVEKCRKKNSNNNINYTLADTTDLNYKKQANKASVRPSAAAVSVAAAGGFRNASCCWWGAAASDEDDGVSLSPRKRGIMFLPALVCLSVCLLFVTTITK